MQAWTDRGTDALTVSAADDAARPVHVADAFGEGAPGLQFDGSTSVLALDSGTDELSAGVSVFWVARAPYLPLPYAWDEVYAPFATLVGGPIDSGWMPRNSVGLSGSEVTLMSLDDELGSVGEPVYTRISGGAGLQEGTGEVRMAGLTYDVDGIVQIYVDGVATGSPASGDYGIARAWSRLGGSMDDAYYGPNSRFGGTVGAIVILPEAADADTVARIHSWARGRFGAR